MLCRVLGKDWSGKDSPGAGIPVWIPPKSIRGLMGDAGSQASPTEILELRSKVEELNSLLEREKKEAWELGYRAGDAAARQSLEGEIRETTSRLASAVSEIASQRPETIRRAEGDTVRLSIEIARRVLHREITVDPAALTALVSAALEKLRNQEIQRVRIHPDLSKLLKSLLEQYGRSAAIEVIPDVSLPLGGVTFEIARGSLDASVETQLREIERGLVDQIRSRS
ncbi:MAG TPA: FliH/SctL family protein [Bryobacteraceae bacterium]|jgi:flagellar assembly protein FliH|nr:FliH/SctL family protein [Bryobacteraceae bacterium]